LRIRNRADIAFYSSGLGNAVLRGLRRMDVKDEVEAGKDVMTVLGGSWVDRKNNGAFNSHQGEGGILDFKGGVSEVVAKI
jgi:hypothetical protein